MLVANLFSDWGQPFAAAGVLLQLDAYLRPSELLNLRPTDVVRPCPEAGRHYSENWGIIVGNAERAEVTKTRQVDDHIVISGTPRWWAPGLLSKLLSKARSDSTLLHGLTLPQLEALYRRASVHLGLTGFDLTPHSARHAGPSSDMLSQARTLAEVKKRGRWSSDKSVARYAKQGRLLLQASRLPKAVQKQMGKASSSFPRQLLLQLSGLRPEHSGGCGVLPPAVAGAVV